MKPVVTLKLQTIEDIFTMDYKAIIDAINTPEHLYVIEARPEGKKSVRGDRGAKWNPSKKTMTDWGWQLKAQHKNNPLFTGPLHLDITYAFKRPKSHSKKRQEVMWHTNLGDLDNIHKTLGDCGQDVLWDNDKIICSTYERKIWCAVDCIIIRVKELK